MIGFIMKVIFEFLSYLGLFVFTPVVSIVSLYFLLPLCYYGIITSRDTRVTLLNIFVLNLLWILGVTKLGFLVGIPVAFVPSVVFFNVTMKLRSFYEE
jgi:hypothetical protein